MYVRSFACLKPTFLNLKELEIAREPPDHMQNETISDIPIGGSEKAIKINKKYISFEMNMMIMYHVHLLSTEMRAKNLQKCLKTHLKYRPSFSHNIITGCQD